MNVTTQYEVAAKVSVIIPCFRCAKTIERAIASILEQTQKPAEVILIDDASDDDTLIFLQKLAKQYPDWIKIIALPENQGAANARNLGWAIATQPYIAFLDADDAWHPQKIEIQYAYMNANPKVVLSGHEYKLIKHSSKQPDWKVRSWKERNISKGLCLLSNRFVTPSVMVCRNIRYRFRQNQRYVDDHLLWLEIVSSENKISKLSVELVAVYKNLFGVSGLSAQLWAMEQGELSNYQYLYDKDYINLVQWLVLIVYSLLKFSRRLIIYWGWLRWQK